MCVLDICFESNVMHRYLSGYERSNIKIPLSYTSHIRGECDCDCIKIVFKFFFFFFKVSNVSSSLKELFFNF